MNYKPILIVAGEPNSVFLEIFFKTIKLKKFKSPLVLIASLNLIKLQMKKLKFKKKINILNLKKIDNINISNNDINLIDINYKTKKAFEKISTKSNKYIQNSFEVALKLINKNFSNKLINGPVSKKSFLNNKFLGITEYLAKKTKVKNVAMLIYNKDLSVSPVTTHLPLKLVNKKINKKMITDKIILINSFYKKRFKRKPKIAITGLNPHCESIHPFNEDLSIIKPLVQELRRSKSKYRVDGPYAADTIFLEKNRKKYDVILGMYHDQVLAPIKTLFEYDAINITLGLPFIRISPDHGPNEKMLGKNLSNPLSLIKSITFLDTK
jgi:4-hydroxythreonine-4-phosphate dehydrogenase